MKTFNGEKLPSRREKNEENEGEIVVNREKCKLRRGLEVTVGFLVRFSGNL